MYDDRARLLCIVLMFMLPVSITDGSAWLLDPCDNWALEHEKRV